MKKLYLVVGLIVLSCKGFKNASIPVDKPLVQLDSIEMNPSATPVLHYNNGVFYSAQTNLSKWHLSHSNISMQKSGTAMLLKLSDVGVDWEEVYLRFKPLDFSQAQALMVKARVDESSKDSLKMRIDLIDSDGNITNYNLKEHYIRSKAKSKTYKFDYNGAWTQGWPVSAKVNYKSIVGMRINFNGSGPNYTGKLYIEEVFASNGKKVIVNPENYPLDDFSEGVSNWWQGGKMIASSDELREQDVMKLMCDKAGPGWESIGYKLPDAIDVSKTPVIKVRMKADNAGVFRIDLEDANGTTTDAQPIVKTFSATEDFVDLYFDFTGKFRQAWPSSKEVDSTRIKTVKCFVNPPKPVSQPPFTGKIWIDEISILSPAELSKAMK